MVIGKKKNMIVRRNAFSLFIYLNLTIGYQITNRHTSNKTQSYGSTVQRNPCALLAVNTLIMSLCFPKVNTADGGYEI